LKKLRSLLAKGLPRAVIRRSFRWAAARILKNTAGR
jgi:hypothetical protein